ncbi:MAG: DUF2721 domain-containing protein [Candidatus Aquirickettsiella gammari]
MINLHLGNIGQIIQLAIAPVFLLTGVGTNLTVLTNRLARIIDRSRVLEEIVSTQGAKGLTPNMRIELDELYQRSHLINRAITLSSTCALLVCLVIAALFLGDALDLHLDKIIAALFVAAVLVLIGSFIFFLREIFVATKTLKRQREHGLRFLP